MVEEDDGDSSLQGSTDSDGRMWEAQRDAGTLGSLGTTWDYGDAKIRCSALFNVDITDVYSPARITQTCKKFRLVPGSALDLHIGWDFTLSTHRLEALRRINEEAPLLLIGSPLVRCFVCYNSLALQTIKPIKNGWLNVIASLRRPRHIFDSL